MTGLRSYGNKRDTAEAEIVDKLRQLKCRVWLIDKPVDALVLRRGVIHAVEIKTGKGKLTEAQQAFIDSGWPVHVLRTVDDAIRFAKGKET